MNKFTDRSTFERKFVGSCRQIVDLMPRTHLELDVTIWLLHDQKCPAFVSLIAVTSCCNRIRDDNFVFGFAKIITTKPFTIQCLIWNFGQKLNSVDGTQNVFKTQNGMETSKSAKWTTTENFCKLPNAFVLLLCHWVAFLWRTWLDTIQFSENAYLPVSVHNCARVISICMGV